MKSTNKILLILASTALLASCGGGTSSSTVPSSEASSSSATPSSELPSSESSEPSSEPSSEAPSSELSSSEEPSSSEPEFEPIEPATGKAALLAAVAKSVDNDAIGLSLSVNGTAGIDGGVPMEVSSSVMPIHGTLDADAAFTIDLAFSGLKNKDINGLKAAASIAGEANYEVTTEGTPTAKQSLGLDSAYYISEGKQYFNLDEMTGSLLESYLAWPYGAGKLCGPLSGLIPAEAAPLISEAVVAQAVAGFQGILDQAEQIFGESLAYYSDGETDMLSLELDAAAIETLLPLFGMPEQMIPNYAAMLEEMDIEACGLSIAFDETGLLGLVLGIGASGTFSPIMMDPGLPASMAEETFDAEIALGIAGRFQYGEDVVVALPDDLDQYEIVGTHGTESSGIESSSSEHDTGLTSEIEPEPSSEESVPSSVEPVPSSEESEPSSEHSAEISSESSEFLDIKEVAAMAEGFKDMGYNAVTMTAYQNGSKVGQMAITFNDENWVNIANNPIYHIESDNLDIIKEKLPESQFMLVDGHLRLVYTSTSSDTYGDTWTTTTIDYDNNGYITSLGQFTDSQNNDQDELLEYTFSWDTVD